MPGCRLTAKHSEVLRIFWMLQHLRTEAASQRAVEMSDDAFGEMRSDSSFSFGIKEAVRAAMETFASSMQVTSDMKMCLVKNATDVPFITSDDPAILTNRWHLDDERARHSSFGMRSSGALLLLPLSPKIYFYVTTPIFIALLVMPAG